MGSVKRADGQGPKSLIGSPFGNSVEGDYGHREPLDHKTILLMPRVDRGCHLAVE